LDHTADEIIKPLDVESKIGLSQRRAVVDKYRILYFEPHAAKRFCVVYADDGILSIVKRKSVS
jgi:hypothetical protein